jgi:hypothetical protein
LGGPDGEAKAVAVGNGPMLPSQKRLLKAMQRGGGGLSERKPSGPPAPSSWSPEHAIFPPVGDADEPSRRSPERQQRFLFALPFCQKAVHVRNFARILRNIHSHNLAAQLREGRGGSLIPLTQAHFQCAHTG